MKKCAAVVFLVSVIGAVIGQTITTQEAHTDRPSLSDGLTSTTSLVAQDGNAETPKIRRPFVSAQWITELFHNAEEIFHMDSTASEPCRNAYDLFIAHLRNQTVWAVRSKYAFVIN